MTYRSGLAMLLMLTLSACARHSAQCEVPPDQIPVAPRAHHARRLVAALGQDGSCRVKLHLPDSSTDSSWQTERDTAVNAAQLAAQACCASPQLANLAAWPARQTHFDLEFLCAQP